MKFLVCGLGSIGRRHLRNLLALGERDILLYRTHKSTLPDEELDEFPVYDDLMTALDQRPDAVIVSNPTALHLGVAIPAAEAGYHLFLEKPVSHSLEELSHLQTALRQSGGKVLVGFQFRFHPGLLKVKQLLENEAIGRPLSARAHWGEYLPDWHPWEDYRQAYSARADLGGGVVLTLCHPLDYLRWLLGEVESLWAFAGTFGDLELDVEDTAEIGIKFAAGAVGSAHLDYNQRPPGHHLEIIGSHGVLRWENASGAVTIHSNGSPQWQTYSIQTLFNKEKPFERNDLFLAEMQHFLELIRGQAESRCSLEDGIWALKLALSALKSAEHGRLIRFSPQELNTAPGAVFSGPEEINLTGHRGNE